MTQEMTQMTRVIMAHTQPSPDNGRTLTFTQILSPQGWEQRIQCYRVTMNIMGSQEGQGGRLRCACQTVSVVFFENHK